MTAFAFLASQHDTKADRVELQRVGRANRLGTLTIVTGDAGQAALSAAAHALAAVRRGQSAHVVGRLEDVHMPAQIGKGQFTSLDWQMSWVAFLEAHGIVYVPVNDGTNKPPAQQAERPSVIRSYQRASALLTKQVQALAASKMAVGGRAPAYLCGRPPYGYMVKNGRLACNPDHVDNVRLIFKMRRKGASPRQILEAVQKTSTEWWDRVKLCRLTKHLRLYCAGEVRTGNTVQRIPSLRILPESWCTPSPAVPSPAGSGTLSAPTPTRSRHVHSR